MYFMHLAIERKGLWIIAGIPLLIVAFGYLMIRPDLSARNWAHTEANQAVGHHEGEQAAAAAPSAPEGQPASGEAQSAPAQP
jgi:hypothetical protein